MASQDWALLWLVRALYFVLGLLDPLVNDPSKKLSECVLLGYEKSLKPHHGFGAGLQADGPGDVELEEALDGLEALGPEDRKHGVLRCEALARADNAAASVPASAASSTSIISEQSAVSIPTVAGPASAADAFFYQEALRPCAPPAPRIKRFGISTRIACLGNILIRSCRQSDLPRTDFVLPSSIVPPIRSLA